MKATTILFVSLSLLGSAKVWAETQTFNFNSCVDLPKSDRDSCLLNLSQKLENVVKGQSSNNGHIEAKVTFRDGMWTNNTDVNNMDQSFHASLTPEVSYLMDHGQVFTASWTAWNQGSISSAEEPASKSYGRPQLTALFPLTQSTIQWKLGGGVRPPAGSSPQVYSNFDSPIPLDRVWEISLLTSLSANLGSRWTLIGQTGVYYNTEYDYKYTTATVDESFFDQWPILSKSSLKIQKDFGSIQLGLGYVGQFGFAGRQIIGGDPSFTGQGNEVLNLPGIRYNAIEFSFDANLDNKFALGLRLSSTLASPDGQDPRLYANPDDPSLSSNLLASASLAKGF